MNRGKLLIKFACGIGYLVFACISAYFTASSFSLSWLQGTNLWVIFAMVLIIGILAGWCLTNAINETKKRYNASKVSFSLNIIGFLIFWLLSFTTNVHYLFVSKHGYTILTRELASAKKYIEDNTTQSNREIDEQKENALNLLNAQMQSNREAFVREMENTREHRVGFGDACINILKSAEGTLLGDAEKYNDKNTYTIYDENTDSGDKGVTQYNRISELSTKYQGRIIQATNKKAVVIKDYYERKKNQHSELESLLIPINELEQKHLPLVLKDGSPEAYYIYYNQQSGRVIAKMPKEYKVQCIEMKDGKVKKYIVYPSERMFDTASVWGDILKGRLTDLPLVQWILISLILDIVSFLLFALFRK